MILKRIHHSLQIFDKFSYSAINIIYQKNLSLYHEYLFSVEHILYKTKHPPLLKTPNNHPLKHPPKPSKHNKIPNGQKQNKITTILYWPTCVDLHDPNYPIFTYMYIHAYNSVFTFIWYMLHCTYKGVSAHKEEVLAYHDEWYE